MIHGVFMICAGRAGRYGSNYPVGEVTCLNRKDLPLLHTSLSSPSPDLEVIYSSTAVKFIMIVDSVSYLCYEAFNG